ncbi:MAG: hypothetical protein ACE5H4_15335, partial [Candidatus Thorarchaeota archaeon]
MRVPVEKISKYDGVTCFICGRYVLNNNSKDLAYLQLPTGKEQRAKPDKFFLFACPNCGKIAHKRCWY